MWTTHLRAAPVPLSALPKQPQRLLRPLAGTFPALQTYLSFILLYRVFFCSSTGSIARAPPCPTAKKAPNESGLSQHIASATAKHYLDFALEVDFFCATEVLFFCEERFWATCFFEEGFLLLATEVLLAAFFEATVVRFLLETALCFELDRLDESVCLPFFCDLETTCLALLCESAASEAVR